MAVVKCKMCGRDLTLTEESGVAACEHCGFLQIAPGQNSGKDLAAATNTANAIPGPGGISWRWPPANITRWACAPTAPWRPWATICLVNAIQGLRRAFWVTAPRMYPALTRAGDHRDNTRQGLEGML